MRTPDGAHEFTLFNGIRVVFQYRDGNIVGWGAGNERDQWSVIPGAPTSPENVQWTISSSRQGAIEFLGKMA